MDSLEAADAARTETARAKNDLEAFILAMQVMFVCHAAYILNQ